MDYQITCVCGHRFLVSGDRIHGQVICPNCRQRLSPVVQSPKTPPLPLAPAPSTSASTPKLLDAPDSSDPASLNSPDSSADPIAASAEETKRCPFCGEVILAIARKCKHCGEFLDRAPNPPGASPASFPPSSASAPPDPASQSPADVPPVYAITVSQWDNFWKFIILLAICALISIGLVIFKRDYAVVGTMGALVISAFIGWFFYMAAKNTRIFIRPLRIDTEQGILSKELNSMELFRITDIELKQGFIERLLRIGTIRLKTSDDALPEMLLYQIPRAREVYKYLQNQIPLAARSRGAVYMEK
jgi:membrane protein YdbS with pleckstrin-like domain